MNIGLEDSRSDLVFEQSRLRYNFIFGILYHSFDKQKLRPMVSIVYQNSVNSLSSGAASRKVERERNRLRHRPLKSVNIS